METTKLEKSDFLDILFDARNKDYGAYELRRRYDRRVRNAVLGMGGLVLLVIGGYTISTKLLASGEVNHKVIVPADIIELKNIPKEEKVLTPPPTIRQPAPAASKPTVQHVVFKIEKDENVKPEDEPMKNADLKDPAIGFKTDLNGDPNGSDNGIENGLKGGNDVIEAPKAEKKEDIPTIVEIMPEFPGGQDALAKFLRNNLRYPPMAIDNAVQGTVFVKFVVRGNGEITDVELIGVKKGAGLDEEALRVVKKMPKWKPGRQNGQSVPVYFNLPIKFHLEGE
ncbi:energy transducer TonB [Chitinophaga lutea]|uniref:Energy transducer TonB n=1 Tax=Chitinophaga lutea TaxID=2488634 RepID=A0A3N4Q5E1_9BACT|nr:energy transducer TonB [Chitinophaga lutea]RPE12731.1 energy transducer TonB [Chitinophaga lutea]